MRVGGLILGVCAAAFPLACGGKTSADAAGDDDPAAGGSDGAALDHGTVGGTGGVLVASGGAPSSGGSSASGGESSTACSEHADCTLASTACCSGCEPVAAGDLVAMNWAAFDQRPECDADCGACPQPSEAGLTGAYFLARCIEDNCRVVDVRDEYAACTTSEDCLLRDGTQCCEDCDGSGYVALSSFGFVSDLGCPPILCAPCPTSPPEGLSAECNTATHRCEKVQD